MWLKPHKMYQERNNHKHYFQFQKKITYLSQWSWQCYFLNKTNCRIRIFRSRSKEHLPVYWTLFHWSRNHCNELHKKNLMYFYILHCTVPTNKGSFQYHLKKTQRLEELGWDLTHNVGSPPDWLQLYWTDWL